MYDVFKFDYYKESYAKVFTEAVFIDGKKRIKPIEEHFQKIKDLLEKEVKENGDKFNPTSFWKAKEFKELENVLNDTFGFRHVSIQPFREKYISKDKMFESKELNACVYSQNRFPIDGLVTEKGFYDSTKSIVMDIYMSLGLIRALSAAEMVAVFLHEFGHSIDPALTDIKYAETNLLSKYLTDRKKEVTKNEKKAISRMESIGFKPGIISFFTQVVPTMTRSFITDIFMTKDRKEKKSLEAIDKLLKKDKTKFDRQHAAEAFADNYARMYGYGPQLAKGLSKMDKDMDDRLNSRYKKEKLRCDMIVLITQNMLKDVHKTDIHRIRSLIKEYHKDINDPNTPAVVKKQMQEDVKELEIILDEYMNNRGEFRNRVNKLINEELKQLENAEEKPIKEDVEHQIDNNEDNDNKETEEEKKPENEEPVNEPPKENSKPVPPTVAEKKQINELKKEERNAFGLFNTASRMAHIAGKSPKAKARYQKYADKEKQEVQQLKQQINNIENGDYDPMDMPL